MDNIQGNSLVNYAIQNEMKKWILNNINNNGYNNILKICHFFNDDEEIVLSEIKKNVSCLQYASERLQNKLKHLVQ